jgi:hypothetical protein
MLPKNKRSVLMTKNVGIPSEDIPTLTDEQILAYGDKIISMPMIPAYWNEITGRRVTRTAPIQARRNGHITPIGKNRNSLYFWRSEVAEYARSAKVGRPSKIQSDDN